MEIQRRGFPELISDNDENFLQLIFGVISSVDELCHIDIVKSPTHYTFRAAPSTPQYLEPILYEILTLMNMLNIRIDMGKSFKRSGAITFNVNITQ